MQEVVGEVAEEIKRLTGETDEIKAGWGGGKECMECYFEWHIISYMYFFLLHI